MPTIGWFEILIVVAIAIVVLGPKDFPVMLKKAGSWIGTAKRYVSNIQNDVSNLFKSIFFHGIFCNLPIYINANMEVYCAGLI